MRAVLQTVKEASVTIDGEIVGAINRGYLIYLGVGPDDTKEEVVRLWTKIRKLRVFMDSQGKTNLDLAAVQGNVLLVSQFTLFASIKKGNRPSFATAAPPALAEALYNEMIALIREDLPDVQTGRFGADMLVSSINDGPFTLWIDTDEL
ncbi:D-aminoacyl-tRNA deacylase [Murdochiella massiliensis]|uniref:D-aminoacyl-tRNA deacylase n=1 Tax=Murdochiella massiliensis TaxID=1673723 RepID=UPI00082E4EB7|nr:D-aminoacyl-tRNA deacylase [Murdochiella massiliensis]